MKMRHYFTVLSAALLVALVSMTMFRGFRDTTSRRSSRSAFAQDKPGKGRTDRDPDYFGIYVSTVNGKDMNRITSDPDRELNHARVSPDNEWITFTRYNLRGADGLALETNGYEETEIMLMRADGSQLQTLVPSKKGVISGNGYWTPDSKSILYVSKPPSRKSEIICIDIATKATRKVVTPKNLWALEPHQVGDQIVFPAMDDKRKKNNTIWIMKRDGSEVRQLTRTPSLESKKNFYAEHADFDPKLSPDGSKVALMRRVGPDNWHIVVIDLQAGKEVDLSEPVAVDGVPEWSSDGKLLIFWHVNLKILQNCGLYTMKPDGTDRKKVPLRRRYFYTMPAFFPGEGSGQNARIIFSAKKDPRL